MEENKTLGSVFRVITPFLAIVFFATAFAGVFNTIDLGFDAALYNTLLFLPVLGLALMLFRRFHVAVAVTTGIAFLLMYVDQLVLYARLTHIRFSDLQLIAQAARVASRYHLIWNFELTRRLFLAAAACGFLLFLFCYYELCYSKKLVFFTGLGVFVLSGAVVLSGVIPSTNEDFDFTSDAENRGLLYSWYCQEKEGRMQAPEGYSRQEAEQILSRYEATAGENDVNVIVIMNESLTDYSLLGTPRFADPLPFLHSLDKNAFHGRLVVSVFGGNTATTEYEFLTGHSAAFFPEGVSPYLQYVNSSAENLTSELKEAGYDAAAIHPYYSEEWNRSQVYRFFGFDRFISGVDFGTGIKLHSNSATAVVPDNLIDFGDGPLYVRGLISDQTSYERVLEELTDKSFVFNVTMQNHGGYDYAGKDFVNTQYVTTEDRKEWTGKPTRSSMLFGFGVGTPEEEVRQVNQYLTCANLSDQALAFLLRELEQREQKTMVLLFGDHQPGLMIPEHYVDCDESENMDYIVPYLLWANYDVEFDAPEITSPNYLSAVLKKNVGLGLTKWDQFRLAVMQNYPVVTANWIADAEGKTVSKKELEEYEVVQYRRMFG